MIIFVKQIIAETNGDSEFRKKYMLHFGDNFPIQKKKEIEGMHSKGSQLQFVIADIKPVKGKNRRLKSCES